MRLISAPADGMEVFVLSITGRQNMHMIFTCQEVALCTWCFFHSLPVLYVEGLLKSSFFFFFNYFACASFKAN